jgi:hypothetical protein
MDCFVQFGICEVLISYIGEYMNNDDYMIGEILEIIEELTSAEFTDDDTISRFVVTGLLNCLVTVYNSYSIKLSSNCDIIRWDTLVSLKSTLLGIVSNLCEFDVDFIHQFNLLGIHRDSIFFSNLPPGPEDLA